MMQRRDRRKRPGRADQLWRYLRTGMRLLLRHPIPSVGVVPLLPDGRIVLVRRVDDDRWAIPGGMIDWGEEIRSAAERELEEETGLRLVRICRLLGVYSSPERDPRTHSVFTVVVAQVEDRFQARDPLEISAVQAFPPAALPWDEMAHDHARVLHDFLEGRTVVA